MSTHDYDYTLWSVGDDESSFEAIAVEISNMIESPQEDYQAFQSNLAVEAARYDASNRMLSTIRTVPTTQLIDGHEAMFMDSFDATKNIAQSVLASEQLVNEALSEIEKLKTQVQLAQLKNQRTRDKSAPSNQKHQQQQQQQQQQRMAGGDKEDYHSPILVSQRSPVLPRPALERYGSSTSAILPDLL
ncbi:hypothetical protein BG004_000623 [Podila humilis]|nr:hypothetical protein BG004_000623 [Podila humilis]